MLLGSLQLAGCWRHSYLHVMPILLTSHFIQSSFWRSFCLQPGCNIFPLLSNAMLKCALVWPTLKAGLPTLSPNSTRMYKRVRPLRLTALGERMLDAIPRSPPCKPVLASPACMCQTVACLIDDF